MTINRGNSWFQTCLLALPLLLLALTAHAAANGLTGNWARDDGAVRMAIVQCGGNFCATNTWVKDPNGSEKVGDELVLTLQPASSSVLQAQAYDVRRKATYKLTLTLQGSTGLQTSGCILLGIVCKSAQWTRTK